MSMYKIKLQKSLEIRVTVLKGTTTGETTVNWDNQKIISGNREEIISSALGMENRVDDIICNLFFDQRSDSELFNEIFLSQEGVSLHTKERALSRLLKAKGIYTRDSDRKQLISKIANIKETRNRFAHGKIYLDKSGAYLEYYQKDGLKTQKLDDKYWEEVENNFNTTFQVLSKLLTKIINSKKNNVT